MGVHSVFWTLVLVLIERGWFTTRCCSRKLVATNKQELYASAEKDQDVIREADQIIKKQSEPNREYDSIEVCQFEKVYKAHSKSICKAEYLAAVNDLSFSVKAGECFALLGVNGAGKSTTFKSLTREVNPTNGSIHIDGFNITTQFEEARKLIGYCPQPNLLFKNLSVEEHINYFAEIKGLPKA